MHVTRSDYTIYVQKHKTSQGNNYSQLIELGNLRYLQNRPKKKQLAAGNIHKTRLQSESVTQKRGTRPVRSRRSEVVAVEDAFLCSQFTPHAIRRPTITAHRALKLRRKAKHNNDPVGAINSVALVNLKVSLLRAYDRVL